MHSCGIARPCGKGLEIHHPPLGKVFRAQYTDDSGGQPARPGHFQDEIPSRDEIVDVKKDLQTACREPRREFLANPLWSGGTQR